MEVSIELALSLAPRSTFFHYIEKLIKLIELYLFTTYTDFGCTYSSISVTVIFVAFCSLLRSKNSELTSSSFCAIL